MKEYLLHTRTLKKRLVAVTQRGDLAQRSHFTHSKDHGLSLWRRFQNPARQFLRAALTVLPLGVALTAQAQVQGQSSVAPRITQTIDESSLVTLQGSVHPLTKIATDLGAASPDTRVDRIQLVLKRSPQQESQLEDLITKMHTPGNSSYHKWLTPAQFGQQFGPADEDIQTIESWVQSHGFSVGTLQPGKGVLEISGTIGQVQDTFHTSIHQYSLAGRVHYANATPPQIPSALAPVLGGFVSLNNFPVHRLSRTLGKATYDPKTGQATPEWTQPTASGSFYLVLSPADWNVQYDVSPLITAGTNGSGQSIAIINDSNINVAFVNNFRTLFGLASNPPQVVIDGNDPGIDGINNVDGANGDSIEAYLDTEWSGAVAPNATINLVIGADTLVEAGLILGAEHAIYNNLAPVMSVSFGACEQSLGSSNAFLSTLWQQAAAQGITVMVSTGDSGSAGLDPTNSGACDSSGSSYAVRGLAVSGYASTPYNVAVGGTDFFYSSYNGGNAAVLAQLGNYWNLTPSPTPNTSINPTNVPIPEQPWNDTEFGLNIGMPITGLVGGSGGASSCVTGTAVTTGGPFSTCTGGYAKPSWQTGTGVPNDSVRDLPDVSLFAADGENLSFYPICASDGDCQSGASTTQITGVGGTSASAPSFAGIMALVNQKYGAQGQADFVLYPLAAQHPAAFHDVTKGTNAQPCALGSVDCVAGGTIAGLGMLSGWSATTGFDLASGWGSIDANQLVTNWNSISFTSTTTNLTSSSTSFAHGTPVTINTSVTGSGGTPTGTVALMTDSAAANQQAQTSFPLTSGSGSGSVNFLPGGTYNIWGQYGGDGKFGASTSSKTQITVSPESSSLILNVVTPTSSGNALIGQASGATNQVPYGTQLVLDGQVVPTSFYTACNGGNSTSTTCENTTWGPPTGNVVFKDGSTTLNTAMINIEGDAEYTTGVLGMGSHSITATYAGDPSYNSSTASAITFTVTQGQPTVSVVTSPGSASSAGPQSVIQGQTVVIQAYVSSGGSGAAPTGTVKFANGTTILGSATLSPTNASASSSGSVAALAVTVTSSPGTYTITGIYSGDSNYVGNVAGTATLTVTASTGLLASTVTTNTPTMTTTSPTAGIGITATVTGQTGHPAPTGTIELISSTADLGGIAITATSASADTSTASITLNSQTLIQGMNSIVLQYSGDTNYQPSSTVLNLQNPLSDFTMVPQSNAVAVASGSSTTDTINFGAVNGFNAAVALTCTAPSAITCSISPTSLTVSGSTTATLTVNATTTTSSSAVRPQNRPGWWWASGGATLACIFMLGLPKQRRKWQGLLTLIVIAVLTAAIGCGGGSSSSSGSGSSSGGGSGGSGGGSTTGNSASGTYTVVVTGTQGTTLVHAVAVRVNVQ